MIRVLFLGDIVGRAARHEVGFVQRRSAEQLWYHAPGVDRRGSIEEPK